MTNMSPQLEKSDLVHEVFNNARVVETRVGSVLVNSPPETLKHLFARGFSVPAIVLLPPDIPIGEQVGSGGFVRQGINYASIEFLLYYNYFVAGGEKTILITVTDSQARRLGQMLHEVIEGPFAAWHNDDYAWLQKECSAVAYLPSLDRSPVVDDLAEIRSLERGGGDLGGRVAIRIEGERFIFSDKGEDFVSLPTAITEQAIPLTVAPPRPLLRQEISLQFIGSSDGFDPNGITTCFLAYLGGSERAVLFDAAAYLRLRLGNMGVSLNQISEVFLTHMHEDHMAGLPELLLMGERRVRIITSLLVYGSLLRMLGAMLDVPVEEVAALFDFHPVDPGHPLDLDGRHFDVMYAVHSIPTLAVRVEGLCYSGDMRYDEAWFKQLENEGVLSPERREKLINFANNALVLIQDVGGGTIHTTLTTEVFRTLAEKSDHLILTHTSKPKLPVIDDTQEPDLFANVEFASTGLVTAIGESIRDTSDSDLLQTITACPLFARLPIEERVSLVEKMNVHTWEPGATIMEFEEPFDGKTYVVHSGLIELWVQGRCILVLGRGNSVGERGALRGEPRTAQIIARGKVQLLSLDLGGFQTVVDRLGLDAAFSRAEWLWKHPKFGHLPWATLLDLALDFEPRVFESEEALFRGGSLGQDCYLLVSGSIDVQNEGGEVVKVFKDSGEFIGGRAALFSEIHRVSARAHGKTEAWILPAAALQRLQMVYPNLVLQLRTGDNL